MNVFIRWIVIALVLAGLGLAPPFAVSGSAQLSVQAGQADDENEDGDEEDANDEGTFESPNYDFTINYGDDWLFILQEFSEDPEGEPVETLILEGELAVAFFTARAGDLDAEVCVQGLARYWERAINWAHWINISDTRPREDDDEPIAGGDEEDAFAVFDFDYEYADGGDGEGTFYLGCQRFEDGEALLLTTIMYFDPDDFDDDEDAREALLEGVELD